jgi:hypothetical protein
MTDLTPFLLPPAIIASILFGVYFGYTEGKQAGIAEGIKKGVKSSQDVVNLVSEALLNELRKSKLELDSLKYPPVEIPQMFFNGFQQSLNNDSEQ